MSSRNLSLFVLALSVLTVVALEGLRQHRLANPSLPMIGEVQQFTLVDSAGSEFNSHSLLGKPWVMNVFFTSCKGPCPRTSAELVRLQREVPQLHAVSISVDPQTDTPEVLEEYARKLGGDVSRWHLLTGQEGELRTLVAETLRLAPADNLLTHSTTLALIDPLMNVRGYYRADDSGDLEQLRRDAASLF